MWDNAPLLRGITNALFALSVLAVLYGAIHYVVHLPQLLPIQNVRLGAATERVAADEVLAVLRHEVQGNLLTVDIERVRKALEKLPWVRNVSIRRKFPDSLAVQYEEHQPLARWNDTTLVNRQGEVFVAETAQELPRFIGYEGSAAEMSQQYAKLSGQLASLNLQVKQLALSPRHAWQMSLSNGMVVELGRDAIQQRLNRFIAVQKIEGQGRMKYVDLRYRNGFAVRQITNEKG
jgi:cell division protein FtsQ